MNTGYSVTKLEGTKLLQRLETAIFSFVFFKHVLNFSPPNCRPHRGEQAAKKQCLTNANNSHSNTFLLILVNFKHSFYELLVYSAYYAEPFPLFRFVSFSTLHKKVRHNTSVNTGNPLSFTGGNHDDSTKK